MEKKDYERELKAIGQRIKQLRIDAGFSSHEAFADTHNLQRKQVWLLEQGANFQAKTLLQLAEIHKISLSQFFEGVK